MTQITTMVWSLTHLEPDILECEVKWALGSITTNKVSGGDGITADLFQILKDDAVKVLHSICQYVWKTQQQPLDWKRSVFILIPKKGNAKECPNYWTTELISHASNVMLKLSQHLLVVNMFYLFHCFYNNYVIITLILFYKFLTTLKT